VSNYLDKNLHCSIKSQNSNKFMSVKMALWSKNDKSVKALFSIYKAQE